MARRPSARAAVAATPATTDTSRACHRPTPKTEKLRYSRPVNTGETYIGFHWSSCHCPNSALFRALWAQTPSSCHVMPMGASQGGSATGNTARSASASSNVASRPASQRRSDRSAVDIGRAWQGGRPPALRDHAASQERVDGVDAVGPRDLLALVLPTRVVGDRQLANLEPGLQDPRRDLGLDVKAHATQGDGLEHVAAEHLVGGLHIGQPRRKQDVGTST